MDEQLPDQSWSFLGKAHDPFLQAAITGGVMVIFQLAGWMIRAVGPEGFSDRLPWIIALAFLLLFAVFNSIFCLASRQSNRYWNRSVIAFLGLGLLGVLIAWGISGNFLTEVGSFRWLYMVVTFCYLVFISIINFMRSIVEYAQKEEWNAPKQTSKKRGY